VVITVTISEINGVSLYYEVKGRGTPIIFIHPPVLSSISFFHQIEGLSDDFMTVRFDIRGHGRSGPSRTPLTYSLIVEDIRQLMNHLEIEKAYLCGYSTGGSVALDFLLTFPEKALGGIVIGGISEVHDLRLGGRICLGIALSKLKAIRPLALSLAWSNSDSQDLFWKTYEDSKQGNPSNLEQYYRCSLHYNCTDRLSSVHLPVLLVYGVKDKGFHSYGQLLHQRLPHSELSMIPNVKHQIPTKASDKVNDRITQFVKTHVAHPN
jgi:pimeloyl-ACP methyl ester carboxylesterase